MSYGNGIKLTAGFDVGAKTPLDSKSVVQTIAERDAFVTDNLAYEGLEVYVKETKIKYRYDGTSWIDLDTQSGSESGTGEGLTTEQANQLTTAYEHSQTPHVSADDIPTKTSDLTNDSGFITSIPSEYITETELETKGYLTEHQSLTDYAKKTDIPDVSDFLTEVPTEYVTDTKLSTELDKKVNKEAGKGLSTNDLTNELVTKINSSATEAFVTNAIANAQLGDKEVDLSGYATVDALKLKADLTHTHDQYLTKVPDEYITETELTDKNYADKTYVTQAVKNVKVDLTGYAKTSDIPKKISQLTNDKGYLSSVPSEYITETELNAKGYLTEHQDISNLALKSEIPDVSSFITSDDLPTVPTKVSDLANDKNYISSIPSEYVTETELKAKKYLTSVPSTYALKTDIPTVPTKTSDLTNDSNFITSIPAEYVTETELKAKGYLTSHQDISGLQTKTDNSLTTTDKTVIGAINELKTNMSNINTSGGSSFSGSYNDLTDKPTIPTKTSDLNNDSGFINTIPAEYITETELNAKGYLTSHQDISNLQSKTDKNLTTTSKEVVGAINELKTGLSSISVPTKVSQLKNDSNYLSTENITNTINSSSTDTQIPSAKAVNDILSTVTGITNAKIYYLLSQLGITTPCTIKDIWDKMPLGSIAIVNADSSIITDLDVIKIALGISGDDEIYGILTVVKLNGRTTLEFRRARTGKSMFPDTFIGYCKGSDCTSISWKQIAFTTGVVDVGVTTITPVNSAITGTLEYTVKNGICYVSMKDLMSTISSTKLLISTTMPKPSINCTASSASVSSSGNLATIYIDKNTTTLRGDFYVKDAKSNCSFSYPVAES